MNKEVLQQLRLANDADEVKAIIAESNDALSTNELEHILQEVERHGSSESTRLDLDELDAVSGGADRDWQKDGCTATCEGGSWCWSNDRCAVWDVTYDNFWSTCPDGSEHEWCAGAGYVCVKCGYNRSL